MLRVLYEHMHTVCSMEVSCIIQSACACSHVVWKSRVCATLIPEHVCTQTSVWGVCVCTFVYVCLVDEHTHHVSVYASVC